MEKYLNKNLIFISLASLFFFVTETYAQNIPRFISSFGGKYLNPAAFNAPGIAKFDEAGNLWIVDRFNQQVKKFSKSGTFLNAYGQFGSGEGAFKNPFGLAFGPDGSFYVSDRENNRIQKFSSNGTFQRQFGGDGVLDLPAGVVVDDTNHVYVSEIINDRITKFDANGNIIWQRGSAGSGSLNITNPQGLAIANNTLYIVDSGNHRIQLYSLDGTYLDSKGGYGVGNGQFRWPIEITVGSNGLFYVTDSGNNRVQAFDSQFQWLATIGSEGIGPNQFRVPLGIAYGSDNRLYIIDSGNQAVKVFDNTYQQVASWGNNETVSPSRPHDVAAYSQGNPNGDLAVTDFENQTVYRFSASGSILGTIGAAGELTQPVSLAIDSANNIYVNNGGVSIYKYLPDGTRAWTFGSLGSGPGQFNLAKQLTVGHDGRIYVADQGNRRIQVLNPDGSFYASWGTPGSGPGQLGQVQGIAMDADGNLLISEIEKRIQKFSTDGTWLNLSFQSPATNEGPLHYPYDLAIDSSGNIYASYIITGRVEIFDASGNYLSEFGCLGIGDGHFLLPSGIAIDSNDLVHVADIQRQRILTFSPPQPLMPSELLSPTNASQSSTSQPVFQWQQLPGCISYRIEVSSDPTFTTPIANVIDQSDLSDSEYPSSIVLTGGTWYWRVTNSDQMGNQSVSEVFSLMVDSSVKPEIQSLSMFKSSVRSCTSAKIQSVVANSGVADATNLELTISVTQPGCPAGQTCTPCGTAIGPFTLNIPVLAAGTTITFNPEFDNTGIEGLYGVTAVLKADGTIVESQTTSFNVGTPTITNFVTFNADRNKTIYYPDSTVSFKSSISNTSSTLTFNVSRQLEIFDNNGALVSCQDEGRFTLAPGDTSLNIQSNLQTALDPGPYTARISVLTGVACIAPDTIFATMDLEFLISDTVFSAFAVDHSTQQGITPYYPLETVLLNSLAVQYYGTGMPQNYLMKLTVTDPDGRNIDIPNNCLLFNPGSALPNNWFTVPLDEMAIPGNYILTGSIYDLEDPTTPCEADLNSRLFDQTALNILVEEPFGVDALAIQPSTISVSNLGKSSKGVTLSSLEIRNLTGNSITVNIQVDLVDLLDTAVGLPDTRNNQVIASGPNTKFDRDFTVIRAGVPAGDYLIRVRVLDLNAQLIAERTTPLTVTP